MFSAFNLGAVGSRLSSARGAVVDFLPEPGLEPTTLGYLGFQRSIPGAVGSHRTAPGEQLGVRCLAQGHFSRGIELNSCQPETRTCEL